MTIGSEQDQSKAWISCDSTRQRICLPGLSHPRNARCLLEPGTISNMARRKHYHVYVVELHSDVLLNARFMRSNPDYQPGKPCVYVGMTGLDPDVRFDKHKAGIQANRYVQEYGQRLLPELYELYNPLTYDEARNLEVELGIDLRQGGYGVWQA